MGRKMFAQGGVVYPMQEGGMAPPMDPMAPPMDPMSPPMAPMPPPMAPMPPPMAPMAEMSQELDPAILEGMLGEYSQQMSDIDNASDATTMINGIRGDELPLEARYAELASVVGQEDAQATPESVLTLVQPVMQLAAIDQGIGGLAEEQMMAPIEGPMAGGIMSTVNMGAPEGPDPVNFSEGGVVEYTDKEGGTPQQTAQVLPKTLRDRYNQELGVMQGIIGSPEDTDKALADQKQMTQAQMLFDIAQGALAFAAPSDREMSAAENLAQSFSPVLGNIGARAGELQKFKQDQSKEGQALKLQALGSAQASMLEQQKQVGQSQRERDQLAAAAIEGALGRGSRESMQEKELGFKQSEGELDRTYQERLANEAILARTALQNLVGVQGTNADAAKAQYQRELAVLQGNIAEASQANVFDFTTRERQSSQVFKENMQGAMFANGQTMLALENDYSIKGMQAKNRLTQENLRLAAQIDVTAATVDFGRKIKTLGIQNAFDLDKIQVNFQNTTAGMEQAHGLSRDLAGYNAVLQQKSQNIQNVFNAGESALTRAGQMDRQVSDQEFRTMLQEDMQEFNLTEAQKVAAIAKLNRAFDEKIATRGADQKDTSLSLAERAQILDETYKLGNLAIDQAAAKAVSLGSKTTTATINYLADPARLAQYAAGTLSQVENTAFEQLILDYTSPKPIWDGTSYVPGAVGQLAPAVRQAMENRQALGNGNIILGEDYVPLSATKEALTSKQIKENALPPEIVSLSDATTDLFNADGSVNRDSDSWNLTQPDRFKSGVNYREVIGASRLVPGVGKFFSEGIAEFVNGQPSDKAKNMALAQGTLDAFANDLLQFATNQSDGRVLKFVQEKIEKEVENIRPGGYFLRTDASAEATFEVLADSIASQLKLGSSILPEYGGKVGDYTKAQVTGVREDMNEMKSFMNELLAFQKGFEFKPKVVTQNVKNQDQGLMTAKEQILKLRRK